MNTDVNPYAVLGVPRDCSADELKSAYRRLARENHPDIAHDKGAANHRMTQINAAWSLIGDPQKRANYDLHWRIAERERVARMNSARPAPTPSQSAQTPRKPSTSRSSSPSGGKTSSRARPTQAQNQSPAPAAVKPSKPTARRPAASGARHARLAEASRLLFKHNKPNEAIDLCRAILKTDFRNIPARELMGEAYLRLGDTDRALAVWEQALVLAPGNVTLRRRWLSLMSPEARVIQERKIPTKSTVSSRATPITASPSIVREGRASERSLFGRILARLGGKR